MSGVFPSVSPTSVSLRSNSTTRVSVSHSKKRQARSALAHRWSIKLNFANRITSEYHQIEGFMDAQHGQAETFTLILPLVPLGTWPGSPVVNGAAQTGYTLNLRGFTASQTGVIKAGDILKSANVAKVYRATADANSNATGLVAVILNCQLVASPADGEAITFSSVPFTVANTSDIIETAIAAALIGSMGIDLIEVP